MTNSGWVLSIYTTEHWDTDARVSGYWLILYAFSMSSHKGASTYSQLARSGVQGMNSLKSNKKTSLCQVQINETTSATLIKAEERPPSCHYYYYLTILRLNPGHTNTVHYGLEAGEE